MASDKEVEAAKLAIATIFVGCHQPCLKDKYQCHCGQAARAALEAAERVRGDGWRTIDSAPKDGTHFDAFVDGRVRRAAWGKTSHVPLYGFCLADQGVEDYDICQPTHWRPLPPPPKD